MLCGMEPDGGGPSARLVIVCGLPGAGKTTLSKRLEADYDAVRMCPDEWMAELGIDLFDQTMRPLVEGLQWQVAERLLGLGVSVVIEWGTWSRVERDGLRERGRALGAAVELRFLDATIDELWRRVDARGMEVQMGGRRLTRDDIVSYAATFERPDDDELALYDAPLG